MLTYSNPQLPDNLVEFSYAQGQFMPIPSLGNTVVLLNLKGTTIHKDSDEARKQIELMGEGFDDYQNEDEPSASTILKEGNKGDDEDEEVELELEDEGVGEEEAEGGDADEPAAPVEPVKEVSRRKSLYAPPKKKLTNQFNFSERAALTYNNPNRVRRLSNLTPPCQCQTDSSLFPVAINTNNSTP